VRQQLAPKRLGATVELVGVNGRLLHHRYPL
jgi:hypothetical protein